MQVDWDCTSPGTRLLWLVIRERSGSMISCSSGDWHVKGWAFSVCVCADWLRERWKENGSFSQGCAATALCIIQEPLYWFLQRITWNFHCVAPQCLGWRCEHVSLMAQTQPTLQLIYMCQSAAACAVQKRDRRRLKRFTPFFLQIVNANNYTL